MESQIAWFIESIWNTQWGTKRKWWGRLTLLVGCQWGRKLMIPESWVMYVLFLCLDSHSASSLPLIGPELRFEPGVTVMECAWGQWYLTCSIKEALGQVYLVTAIGCYLACWTVVDSTVFLGWRTGQNKCHQWVIESRPHTY